MGGFGSFLSSAAKIVAPVTSLATSAGSSALSYLGGEKRNEAQVGLSQDQMDFQERMSSTAYQRAMKDMRKAGLNPILAGKLGGASSPGGAMPVLNDTISPAVNSGWNAYRAGIEKDKARAEISLKKEQENKTRSEINKIGTEIKNLDASRDLTNKQIKLMSETIHKIQQEALNLQERTKGLTLDNALKKITNDFYNDNNTAYLLKEMGGSGLFGSIFGSITGLFGRKRGKIPTITSKPRAPLQ